MVEDWADAVLSSGLTSRPSLSGKRLLVEDYLALAVVGVNLPTFVERSTCRAPSGKPSPVVGVNLPTFVERNDAVCWRVLAVSVVGVNLPTFVERWSRPCRKTAHAPLSSGLTSRPSLSGRLRERQRRPRMVCRRG